MWIDNINFQPITPRSGLIGFASIDLFINSEESLYLGNIAVYSIRNRLGYRITYPTRKVRGSQIPIFKPSNPKIANKIKDAIIKRVEQSLLGEYDDEN